MKKVFSNMIKIAVVILVGGIFVFSCLLTYKKQHTKIAVEKVKKGVESLENYYSKHGDYPETLESIGLNSFEKKVLYVFPTPKLNYRKKGEFYIIEFYQFPLGPFYGFNKASEEWFYEE